MKTSCIQDPSGRGNTYFPARVDGEMVVFVNMSGESDDIVCQHHCELPDDDEEGNEVEVMITKQYVDTSADDSIVNNHKQDQHHTQIVSNNTVTSGGN